MSQLYGIEDSVFILITYADCNIGIPQQIAGGTRRSLGHNLEEGVTESVPYYGNSCYRNDIQPEDLRSRHISSNRFPNWHLSLVQFLRLHMLSESESTNQYR